MTINEIIKREKEAEMKMEKRFDKEKWEGLLVSETEKAICVIANCENTISGKEFEMKVWIPKSIILDGEYLPTWWRSNFKFEKKAIFLGCKKVA